MIKMYNRNTGNITCDRCGELIGNINGDGNFFALIRQKWCPVCKATVTAEEHCQAQRAYRKRKKREKQLEKTKIKLLEEENELLRKAINKLRGGELS